MSLKIIFYLLCNVASRCIFQPRCCADSLILISDSDGQVFNIKEKKSLFFKTYFKWVFVTAIFKCLNDFLCFYLYWIEASIKTVIDKIRCFTLYAKIFDVKVFQLHYKLASSFFSFFAGWPRAKFWPQYNNFFMSLLAQNYEREGCLKKR